MGVAPDAARTHMVEALQILLSGLVVGSIYGLIGVGPDPGSGDAKGARWPEATCWRPNRSAIRRNALDDELINGGDALELPASNFQLPR